MGKGVICHAMVPLASLHGRGSDRAISAGGVPLASLHGRGSDRAISAGGVMIDMVCTEIPRQLGATAME